MTASNFEELEIWQLARTLTRRIYEITRDGGFARDFGLVTRSSGRLYR